MHRWNYPNRHAIYLDTEAKIGGSYSVISGSSTFTIGSHLCKYKIFTFFIFFSKTANTQNKKNKNNKAATSHYIDGCVSKIRMYNKELVQSQIDELYTEFQNNKPDATSFVLNYLLFFYFNHFVVFCFVHKVAPKYVAKGNTKKKETLIKQKKTKKKQVYQQPPQVRRPQTLQVCILATVHLCHLQLHLLQHL